MKKIIVFLVVFLLSVASLSEAKSVKIQGHFTGIGSFIWFESLRKSPDELAKQAKEEGLSFVIIKAFDGRLWAPTSSRFDEKIISAFHRQGIKVYGYGTTYLRASSSPELQAENAIRVLHLGADGVVLDDVFGYGSDDIKTESLFRAIRLHIKKHSACGGKILAFSTFPHIGKGADRPWDIPVYYCDYYLPQMYWEQLRMSSPKQCFSVFRENWNEFRKEYGKPTCRVIPVAQSNDEDKNRVVTPNKLTEFFQLARRKRLSGMRHVSLGNHQ